MFQLLCNTNYILKYFHYTSFTNYMQKKKKDKSVPAIHSKKQAIFTDIVPEFSVYY